MINTNSTDIEQVMKLGNKVRINLEIREKLDKIFHIFHSGKIREFVWPRRESGHSVILCFMSKQYVHLMVGYGRSLIGKKSK